MQAALITAAMVVGLTVYAFTTKSDFTFLGPALFVVGFALCAFGIILMFTHSKTLYLIYCFLAVILFGFYLIFDTQLIIGGHHYELNEEEYIVGAMILYLDIINLFIYVLRILGESNR